MKPTCEPTSSSMLEGKVAFVSGIGPGMGRDLSLAFARHGADVAVGGRYYGWFPMATEVDVAVSPTADGLRDDGPHRQARRLEQEGQRFADVPVVVDHVNCGVSLHPRLPKRRSS